MSFSGRKEAGLFFILVLALFSCGSNSIPKEVSLPLEEPPPSEIPEMTNAGSGGLVDEIRLLTETGSPSSLLGALEIIRGRNLQATEYGRMMITVNVTLLEYIYPAVLTSLPQIDPPVTYLYSRIISEAERGLYTAPRKDSIDYLEHVLPFLGIFPGRRTFPAESYLSALPDLTRAAKINGESVLAPYFMALSYEQLGRFEDANIQYAGVLKEFPECYPAALGIARIMEALGRKQEAENYLLRLDRDFPDNLQVKRHLALFYYHSRDWPRANAAVDVILQADSRDRDFLLIKAHILVEQGQLLQAQEPLAVFAGMEPNNSLQLFLRSRIQAEAYNNREAALNYLRTILRTSTPSDPVYNEAAVFAARFLMESPLPQDQIEGRNLLIGLLAVPEPSLEVLSLALWDAVRREIWPEARSYLSRLLEERRSPQDLQAAYTVEKEQGNFTAALSYARELYERNRSDDEGNLTYISALIDVKRYDEAARMIESRIGSAAGGVLKSRYFFLRSQTRANEDLIMSDLRSSLFEDPRNLNAIIATFEIYHRRGDERQAVYYLRQALALAPDNLRLKRYEIEYAPDLRGTY